MDRKSKVLIIMFAVFLIISIFLAFYRFFIIKDYIILDSSQEE